MALAVWVGPRRWCTRKLNNLPKRRRAVDKTRVVPKRFTGLFHPRAL